MKFRIDGTEYDMIQTNVTFAEARAIEKVTGQSFTALAADEEVQQSLSVVQAMLWISMKRVNPTMVFSDLDDVDISAVEYIAEEADEPVAEPAPLEDSVALEATTSPSLV